MPKERIDPSTVASTLEHGFSQCVVASGRRTLYLSGQTAWDARKQLIGRNDLGQQAMQAFGNVRRIVEAAGGSLDDVVSIRVYVVGLLPDGAAAVGAALRASFSEPRIPATTWIGVSALARPEFLIEVEAVAVLD